MSTAQSRNVGGWVWRYQDKIIYSPNSSAQIHVPDFKVHPADYSMDPPLHRTEQPALMHLSPIFTPQWAKGHVPQLPFVQTIMSESDPIFRSLAFKARNPPLVRNAAGFFSLKPYTLREWQYIDSLLDKVVHVLLSNMRTTWPLYFRPTARASKQFPLILNSDPGDFTPMKRACLRARKCLVLDAALVSYLMAMYEVEKPNLDTYTLLASALAPVDLDRIFSSSIPSWKASRVGVLMRIDVDHWPAHPFRRAFALANIPIWLQIGTWGNNTVHVLEPLPSYTIPSHSLMPPEYHVRRPLRQPILVDLDRLPAMRNDPMIARDIPDAVTTTTAGDRPPRSLFLNGLSVADYWQQCHLDVSRKFMACLARVDNTTKTRLQLREKSWSAVPGSSDCVRSYGNFRLLPSYWLWEPQPVGAGWRERCLTEPELDALEPEGSLFHFLYNAIDNTMDLLPHDVLQRDRHVRPSYNVSIGAAWYDAMIQAAESHSTITSSTSNLSVSSTITERLALWGVELDRTQAPRLPVRSFDQGIYDPPSTWLWRKCQTPKEGWTLGMVAEDAICALWETHGEREFFYNSVFHEYHVIPLDTLEEPRRLRNRYGVYLRDLWLSRPGDVARQLHLLLQGVKPAARIALEDRSAKWSARVGQNGVQMSEDSLDNPTIWLWEPVAGEEGQCQLRLTLEDERVDMCTNRDHFAFFYNTVTHSVEVAAISALSITHQISLGRSSITTVWKALKHMQTSQIPHGNPSRLASLMDRARTWSTNAARGTPPKMPTDDGPNVWLWDRTSEAPEQWTSRLLSTDEIHQVWAASREYDFIYDAILHRFQVISRADLGLLATPDPNDVIDVDAESSNRVIVNTAHIGIWEVIDVDAEAADSSTIIDVDASPDPMDEFDIAAVEDVAEAPIISPRITGSGEVLRAADALPPRKMFWTPCENADNLADLMSSRGGLHLQGSTRAAMQGISTQEWELMTSLWCFPDADQQELPDVRAAFDFTQDLLRFTGNGFASISNMSPWPLHPCFSLSRAVATVEDLARCNQTPPIMVTTTVFYLSNLRDLHSYSVVVFDRTSAVQCLRMQDVLTCQDLVRELVRRRIPCSAVVPLQGQGARAEPFERERLAMERWTQNLSLGVRPDNFRASDYDGFRYLHEVRQFAKSSRSRAAILAGGLYSRIVAPFVDVDDAVLGPSRDATLLGHGLTVTGLGARLIGDGLFPQEKDLLCGTYRVRTKNKSPDTLLSWWPRESHWSKCKLHVGQWSPVAETWFCDRMEEIVNGTAVCLSGAAWKLRLRGARSPAHARKQGGYQKVSNMRDALEIASQREMDAQQGM